MRIDSRGEEGAWAFTCEINMIKLILPELLENYQAPASAALMLDST